MNDLLRNVLEAHGGLARWNKFSTVRAQIVTGGGLWPLKGLIQDAAPRQMTVSLHEEFASVTPFGQPNWRTNFRPERLAFERLQGEVVRERENHARRLRPHDEHPVGTPSSCLLQWLRAVDILDYSVLHGAAWFRGP